MTDQEFFNIAWNRALVMTSWACDEHRIGRLRSPSGPCLVGAAIPDEQYSPDLENTAVLLINEYVPSLMFVSKRLIEEVMDAHDDFTFRPFDRELMLIHLRSVAERRGFSIPGS